MSTPSSYEAVLAAAGARPPRPPRASASIVLWRRDGAGRIETYWVQRAPGLPFMGGWYAFPGGTVSRTDPEAAAGAQPRGAAGAPADGGMPEEFVGAAAPLPDILAPGVVAAALRELAEETGLEGIDPGELVYAGRWLTPPLGPLRFDNRFFLLHWPVERPGQPVPADGELVEGTWIRPVDALALWEQGRALAAPPILHLLRVLEEQGPEAGLARLRDAREANLGPFRRIEFFPGMLSFPLATATLPPATHTNAYVLGWGDAVLVDPGSADPAEQARLLTGLQVLAAAEGRRVREIWLTHHHPDHVGGAAAVAAHLDLPLHAHPATAERLAGRGLRIEGDLVDGRERDLSGSRGMRLRVLHTPGHARGHVVILDRDRRGLVAGDLVSAVSTIVIDPPEGDMDEYLNSLARVRSLDPAALLPAHGPAIAAPGAFLDRLIEHRRAREAAILERWRAGVREAAELVPAVYSEVDAALWPLAARQVEAHLERLRRGGHLSGAGKGSTDPAAGPADRNT